MSDASHKSVPEWAMERMRELTCAEGTDDEKWLVRNRTAFARYIAEHEEAPVDPLLIEAREICASRSAFEGGKRYIEGRYDDCFGMECTLAALRRGIEIGGAK